MKRIKILFSLYILLTLTPRFLPIINFKNTNEKNSFISYKKIAQKISKADELKGVIIMPENILKTIKIYKFPIGITNNNSLIEANTGQLFYASNEQKNLIKVEGNHKLWPKYYKQLEKLDLLDEIYQVYIYEYRIDLWVHPGVLVQLGKSIQDFAQFKKNYPHFFQKGILIDLRETKRVGISKLKNI